MRENETQETDKEEIEWELEIGQSVCKWVRDDVRIEK